MRIFTKVDNKLIVYETNTDDVAVAIQLVKDELGTAHKTPVLALVKY